MRPSGWFSSPVLTDIAGWLCLLAVLALVALVTSGVLEIALTAVVVIAGVVALVGSRPGGSERPERGRAAPLLAALAPVLVALVIAEELVSDEWHWFAVIAIAFPLMLVWRHVYWRWLNRPPSHDVAD
jgi:hypothetical protein